MTIRQTIASFELHLLAENKSPKTVRTYSDAVRKLAADRGISDLAAVSRQDIERHMASLLGRYSPGYASNQYRALQQFYKWLAAEDECPDPMAGMKVPAAVPKAVPVFADRGEIERMIWKCRGRTLRARRDTAILTLFRDTGCRLAELSGLAEADVDLKQREALVTGKGGRQRVVRFSPGGECCASRISVRMVQSIHAVLRNALESAVREEVIPRNVAKLVKVTTPKYAVNRGLTVVQARKVLRGAKGERLYALYVLALCLGLRRGELLGLRWADTDLDTGTLEVVQTLQRVGGALRFVRPKTENSARTVPLPPLCINALREHQRQQFTERADAWPDWQENGLVFPTRIGTPMEPDNLRRSWGRIRTTASLTGTRFHDLRHTCVSLLLHLGVPPDMVREIVGHSDIEVTMTIYAHTSLDEKRQALGKLGQHTG